MTLTQRLRADLAAQVKSAAKRRAELTQQRATINKLERIAKRAGGAAIGYIGTMSPPQVHIYIDGLDSFTSKRVVKMLAAIDDIAPFEGSYDGADGRVFASYKPLYVSVRMSLIDPDGGEKCRRVVKEVRAGAPEVVYGYECK